ncbi:MAG: glycosyltransferase family 4 protein [Candidatus Moranbacteria bacterium]|nr:glycosyltransferase family 4 protein [Candidatus Moranbacteria bacterium]
MSSTNLDKTKKPIKIAIDIRNIGRNRTGSETVILQLVKHLLKIDPENQYKLLTDTDEKKVLNYINEHLELSDKKNVEVISLQAKNKFIWAAWTVWRWARKNPVDIYHTEYILPFFMPKSIKLITHIHDVSFRVYRKMISWKDIFFLDIFIPWSIKRADKIIAVSQFTKDEIEKYYPVSQGKIELIYNAVADDFAEVMKKKCQKLVKIEKQIQSVGFSNAEVRDFELLQDCQIQKSEKFKEIQKKYNLPEKYILALGTMQPRKNIPFLVKSYSKIYKKLDDVKLVLVGKKAHNFDMEIEKLIEKSDDDFKKNVIFTGYVDENDKAFVFAGAEIFAYPSLYEGFGIPPLESIHCGTPVVASNISVHAEIFKDAVKYFNLRGIDQCAKVLYDTASNDDVKKELVKKAFELKSKFSYEKSAKKFLSLCQKVVE